MTGTISEYPTLSGTLSADSTLTGSLSAESGLIGVVDLQVKSPYYETSNEFGTTLIIG